MTDEPTCEVVATADDSEWLAGFTRRLLEGRPAACGHRTARSFDTDNRSGRPK
jgi:hypothetical protein